MPKVSERKFYRTVIQVEVLSEQPFDYFSLQNVHDAIDTGDCSGKYQTISTEEVDGKRMAEMLIAQGSAPEFFRLSDDGSDDNDNDNF